MRARVAQTVNRVAGIGLRPVLVFLDLEVVAQIVDFDVSVDHQAFGEVLQPRYPQAEVALRIGDRQLISSLPTAMLGDVLAREGIAVLAPEGAEELQGSPPPAALASRASLVGLRWRHVQDARKFTLVLHRPWIQ